MLANFMKLHRIIKYELNKPNELSIIMVETESFHYATIVQQKGDNQRFCSEDITL